MRLERREPGAGEYIGKGLIRTHKKDRAAAEEAYKRKVAARKRYERHLKEGTLSYQEFKQRVNNFPLLFLEKEEMVGVNKSGFERTGVSLDAVATENPMVFKGLDKLVYEIQTEQLGLSKKMAEETMKKEKKRLSQMSFKQIKSEVLREKGTKKPYWESWPSELKDKWFRKALPKLYKAYKILRKKGLTNAELGIQHWL